MKTSIALLASLVAASSLARAADEAKKPSVVPEGWYVAPMLSFMKADKGRCGVRNGVGPALAFGHRGDLAALELSADYQQLSYDCSYTVPAPTMSDPNARSAPITSSGKAKLTGFGLGLVFTPFNADAWYSHIFGLLGFGVQMRKNHPQYTDGKAMFADAGVGYLYPLQLFGLDSAVRAEARYRFDVQQPPYSTAGEDPPQKHAYQDVLINIGLQIALSHPPEPLPPPAPEPVQVVPAAEPAPAPVAPAPAPAPEPAPTDAPGTSESDSSAVIETAKAGDTIVLHGVTFNTGKSTLTSNAKTVLDDVAAKLSSRPELKVEIGGHTDSRGSGDYNQHLSEKRAQSVLDYLVSKGVDAGRLSAQGYGPSQPVDSNDTDEGRERNRRVELKVLG